MNVEGWVDGRIDGWMLSLLPILGWTDGWWVEITIFDTHGCRYECLSLYVRMDERTNGWVAA